MAALSTPIRIRPTQRPAQIDPYLRTEWHIAALLLAINKSHGGAAGLGQLHLLMWALRFPSDRNDFLAWWSGTSTSSPVGSARFDPFLEKVLTIAIADGLVIRSRERWALTTAGKDLLQVIQKNPNLLAQEKEFLAAIDGKVSGAAMTRRLS